MDFEQIIAGWVSTVNVKVAGYKKKVKSTLK